MNNEKKQVVALWILGVLVVILIAIIVGLFIMQAQAKNQEVAAKDAKMAQMEQELAQVKSKNEEVAAKDIKIVQLENELAQVKNQNEEKTNNIVNKEELVTTAFYKEYTPEESGGWKAAVKIPKINLEFEGIKKLNEEIYNKLSNKESHIYDTEYEFYLNKNILSLIIMRKQEAGDNKSYSIYNIDINTGNCLANSEILRAKGIEPDEYTRKLLEIGEERYKSRFSALYNQNEGYKLLDRTLSYWNDTLPMFLDDDNTINVIAKYYTEIGSGYVIEIFDTQI